MAMVMYLDMRIPNVPRFISQTAEATWGKPRKDLFEMLTEDEREAIIATISFYKKLHNLGYTTLRDAIYSIERGEVPVDTIDEVFRPGECFLFPEIAKAIETGYVETGRANLELAKAFYENWDKTQIEYGGFKIQMSLNSLLHWNNTSNRN